MSIKRLNPYTSALLAAVFVCTAITAGVANWPNLVKSFCTAGKTVYLRPIRKAQ